MSIEELEKQIYDNTTKIIENINKIENNKKNIQKNSYALEILKDYKKQNKRLFIILILELIAWIITLVIFHL